MKVLFIITGFGMKRGIGGAAIRTIKVAQHFSKWEHEVHFLTTRAGEEVISRHKIDCEFHIVRSTHLRTEEKNRFDRVLSFVVSTADSLFKIKTLPEFDIVISTDDYFCHTIPAFFYKLRGKAAKWVAYAHEPPVYIWSVRFLKARKMGHKLPLLDALNHLLYAPFQEISFILFKINCDKILTIGTEGDLIKRHLRLPSDMVDAVGNGIDTYLAESVTHKKSVKTFDACFLGGFRPSKGIFDLIPIWEGVVDKKKDASLLLIGSGVESVNKVLGDEIKQNNLEQNIEICGFIHDRRRLFRLLSSSSVFIFPSHKEGWAMPIMEAMSCGLPAVVWNYPFYKEVYDDRLVYVDLGKFSSFSDQILSLLSNEHLYSEYSSVSKKFASKHGWDRVSRRELNILSEMFD